MALLQLSDVALSVGSTQLLESVSTLLVAGQRVALVGPNGCGKSTLLRALALACRGGDGGGAGAPEGDDSPTPYFVSGAGSVTGALVGARSAVLHVEQDALQWSRLLGGCEEDIVGMTVSDAIDVSVGDDGEAVDRAVEDGDAWRALCVAAGDMLGWKTAGYDTTPIESLSPGCSVRAYLAVALARRDIQLLLLDEPTNHLDLPSVLWLQHAVIASGKALVVVSHDVAFLDAVADHVWAMDPLAKTLTVSGVGYSAFRRAEQLARDQHRAAYESQAKRRERLTAAADKLRAATAAGSRFEASDHDTMQRDFKRDRPGRSGGKAKAIETLRDSEARIERPAERAAMRIEIEPLVAGGDSSIVLSDVTLANGGVPLPLPPVSLRIDFGECRLWGSTASAIARCCAPCRALASQWLAT